MGFLVYAYRQTSEFLYSFLNLVLENCICISDVIFCVMLLQAAEVCEKVKIKLTSVLVTAYGMLVISLINSIYG